MTQPAGSWYEARHTNWPQPHALLKQHGVEGARVVACVLLLLLLEEGHVALPGFILPEVCQREAVHEQVDCLQECLWGRMSRRDQSNHVAGG